MRAILNSSPPGVVRILLCCCCLFAASAAFADPDSNATLVPATNANVNASSSVTATATTNATAESSPAPVLVPQPIAIPEKKEEIRGQYSFGIVTDAAPDLYDDHISAVVRAACAAWAKPLVRIAWYAAGTKPGQGLLAMGESRDGQAVRILRPQNPQEALRLERELAFPTSPAMLSSVYLENEVTADDDFQGKSVLFEAPIADIARGAFGRPYAFFPSAEGSVTGITCYFSNKDPNLRRIRKGLTVKVRGTVKGFLMQDVILEECEVLSGGQVE